MRGSELDDFIMTADGPALRAHVEQMRQTYARVMGEVPQGPTALNLPHSDRVGQTEPLTRSSSLDDGWDDRGVRGAEVLALLVERRQIERGPLSEALSDSVLRLLRTRRGLTIRQVAEATGVHRSVIDRIEHGRLRQERDNHAPAYRYEHREARWTLLRYYRSVSEPGGTE